MNDLWPVTQFDDDFLHLVRKYDVRVIGDREPILTQNDINTLDTCQL